MDASAAPRRGRTGSPRSRGITPRIRSCGTVMETALSASLAAAVPSREPPRLDRHPPLRRAGRTATAQRSGATIRTASVVATARINVAWTGTTTAGLANAESLPRLPSACVAAGHAPPRPSLEAWDPLALGTGSSFRARSLASQPVSLLLTRMRVRRCRGLSQCSGCTCASPHRPTRLGMCRGCDSRPCSSRRIASTRSWNTPAPAGDPPRAGR